MLRLYESCSYTIRCISSDDAVPGGVQDDVGDGGKRQQTAGWDHGVCDRSMRHKGDVNSVGVELLLFLIKLLFQEVKHVYEFGEVPRV